ncbi:MAG: helix-turn-helix transcriptional regulator [Burkholderiales bacterium]|nr:helix-turn-helix transcriptional regulator [Burkholderiales bacterium]MCC7116874.1 helix-turn-helix transcriptional regulator [Burkholderiales bacterium]
MSKKSDELTRLRQTCCLGLASEIVVPQIVEDLHRLIDSDRVHFAWSDDLGNIVNAYFEKPDPAALDWLRHNHRRFEEEVGISVRQSILFGKPTGNYRWPYRKGFEATESYARLFGGLGLKYSLDGVVRDRFRPLGQVVLFRRIEDPDFSVDDEDRLAQTLPYIAHAIAGPQKTPEAFVETGDSGLLVFDADGRLSFQSAQAKELIVYALHEQIPVGAGEGLSLDEVERQLSALHARISKIHEQPATAGAPPVWALRNRWGEFQLRAYVLDSPGGGRGYGVTVERKVPLEMRMLQKVKEMPLSIRQREVCFLLLRGVDNEAIAQMLGITRPTLKEYTRAIYRKLGVARREDLVRLALE